MTLPVLIFECLTEVKIFKVRAELGKRIYLLRVSMLWFFFNSIGYHTKLMMLRCENEFFYGQIYTFKGLCGIGFFLVCKKKVSLSLTSQLKKTTKIFFFKRRRDAKSSTFISMIILTIIHNTLLLRRHRLKRKQKRWYIWNLPGWNTDSFHDFFRRCKSGGIHFLSDCICFGASSLHVSLGEFNKWVCLGHFISTFF